MEEFFKKEKDILLKIVLKYGDNGDMGELENWSRRLSQS